MHMSVSLDKITDGSPVNTGRMPVPVMITGKPVAKRDPVVTAVRLHTAGGLYKWLDVAKHRSGAVTIGYRDRTEDVTVTRRAFRHDWTGELRRHMVRLFMAGDLSHTTDLRGV